jgi:hypothetical protein
VSDAGDHLLLGMHIRVREYPSVGGSDAKKASGLPTDWVKKPIPIKIHRILTHKLEFRLVYLNAELTICQAYFVFNFTKVVNDGKVLVIYKRRL